MIMYVIKVFIYNAWRGGRKEGTINNLNGLDYNSATGNFMKYNWLLIASIKQCKCEIKYKYKTECFIQNHNMTVLY